MKEVTDHSFELDVIKSSNEQLVLVDFWAPWCGPCLMVAPVLEKIQQNRDDLSIVKINIDDNPKIASNLEIKSIPFLAFYKNGKKVHELIGFHDESVILSNITKHI